MPSKNWWDYPICVPFGNTHFDTGYYASHDLDVQTPPNTPVTFPLSGVLTTLTSPDWGQCVAWQLDHPYNGVPYASFLHLAAINPALQSGQHINPGDLAGWSGGCNDQSQYAGTSNPTGSNFTNSSNSSSQPQTGLALMFGPEYGVDAGWENYPPVDWRCDPTQIILTLRLGGWSSISQQAQAMAVWAVGNLYIPALYPGQTLRAGTGIYASWCREYQAGRNHGFATTMEIPTVDWKNNPIMMQWFSTGDRCEWMIATSVPTWYGS